MNGLKRARAMKVEIVNTVSVLQPPDKMTSKRPRLEEDPESKLIKVLRDDEKKTWRDIADTLNEGRRARREAANFTGTTVYSCYVRSTVQPASPVNEIGFNSKDYIHLRHPGADASMVSKVGKKRVKDYENAKELTINMRNLIKNDDGTAPAELETAEKSEKLMQAVAKVERNFWILVADEMERATTRLYEPDALARRFHTI
ncbi:hypothetical protein GQ44DRAFT_615542 [Phaeosphaeriaceae sp. PMI808]|nr:hypothetical protein GQ44DRAFT_615542 [Phaeosphaeriaceae sp. PMI808]